MKNLKNIKSFKLWSLLEAELIKNDKIKINEKKSGVLNELEKLSPESIEYINAILEALGELPNREQKDILISVDKKVKKLKVDDFNKLVEGFQNPDDDLEFNKWIVTYFTKEEIIEKDVKGESNKEERDALKSDIDKWNNKYESIFKFENNVGDKVSNKEESEQALEVLAKVLNKHKKTISSLDMSFVGHTSTPGDEASNQKLSEQRAKTVKNIFNSKFGDMFKEQKLILNSEGKGETQPKFPDDEKDAEKQAKNRRVEIQVKQKANVKEPDVIETRYIKTTTYVIYIDKSAFGAGGDSPKFKKTPKIKSAQKRVECPSFVK